MYSSCMSYEGGSGSDSCSSDGSVAQCHRIPSKPFCSPPSSSNSVLHPWHSPSPLTRTVYLFCWWVTPKAERPRPIHAASLRSCLLGLRSLKPTSLKLTSTKSWRSTTETAEDLGAAPNSSITTHLLSSCRQPPYGRSCCNAITRGCAAF